MNLGRPVHILHFLESLWTDGSAFGMESKGNACVCAHARACGGCVCMVCGACTCVCALACVCICTGTCACELEGVGLPRKVGVAQVPDTV